METINKEYFLKKIQAMTNKPFKMRFIKKGKYGLPECWIYPIDFKQEQSKIEFNGKLYKYNNSGLLVTLETLSNKKYLKEYLQSCF